MAEGEIGRAAHLGSDMSFGQGKPYAIEARHTLTNVREDESPWFPGQPDEHLPRGASFELGRSMAALGPGPQEKKRRPAGGNPEAFKRLRQDWPKPGQPGLFG
jgi:hypothetical protein